MIGLTALLAAAVGAALLGKDDIAGSSLEPVERSLMKLEAGAMERWRNGDPMRWAEISAPEVTYVDPGLTKPIVGLAAYTAYLKALKGKVSYEGSEFLDPKVALHGNLAVLSYNYRSTTKNPDGTTKGQTLWNTTEVYARSGAEWRIVHTHWSFVGHTAPETVEVPVLVSTVAKTPDGVLGELMTLEAKAMERWRKGDPWGFTEISSSAVTYFDSGTPHRLNGLSALKEEYGRRVGKIRYDVMEFLEPTVQVHGGAAVLFYRFHSTRLRSDGSVEFRIPWNCTEVYAKSEGSWRIVHTHWSLINGRVNPATAAG